MSRALADGNHQGICTAASATGIDPDRIKFLGTVRIVGRLVTDRTAFP